MTTIKEDFVSFETAKLLKEKGFNERLLTFYITDEVKKEGYFELMAFTDDKIDNNHSDYCYLAPTLQMVTKWLREIYGIYIILFHTNQSGWWYNISDMKDSYVYYSSEKIKLSYEEVVEIAIKYCLENLI